MGNKLDICYGQRTTFIGQIKKQIFHGEGTLYYNDTGDLYKGTFKNGLKHGLGEFHYYNGDKYIGEFYKDEMHGKGKYINNNGYTYEGNFTLGTLLDEGKIFNVNGELLYEGEFINSLPHGFGISYINNTVSYVGMWNQNMYHGHGLLIEDSSHKYGLYQDGFLVEQINKIPKKFYKYINKPQIYDSNINLTKYVDSKQNFKYDTLQPSAPPLIVDNPVNFILANTTQIPLKSTFNPMNTRN